MANKFHLHLLRQVQYRYVCWAERGESAQILYLRRSTGACVKKKDWKYRLNFFTQVKAIKYMFCNVLKE